MDGGAADSDDTSTILGASWVPGVTVSALNVTMSHSRKPYGLHSPDEETAAQMHMPCLTAER